MPIIIVGGGGGGGGGSTAWGDITGKPATFTPTVPIAQADVTGLPTAVNSLDDAGFGVTFNVIENLEYILSDDFPFAGTITKVTRKSRSGTANMTLKVNGVAVTGVNGIGVTSTRQATGALSTAVSKGDIVSVEFSANASIVDLTFTVWILRTV